jgi:hypothetical protein
MKKINFTPTVLILIIAFCFLSGCYGNADYDDQSENQMMSVTSEKTVENVFVGEEGEGLTFRVEGNETFNISFETQMYVIAESDKAKLSFGESIPEESFIELYVDGEMQFNIETTEATDVVIAAFRDETVTQHGNFVQIEQPFISGWILKRVKKWLKKTALNRYVSWFDYCGEFRGLLEDLGYYCPIGFDDAALCVVQYWGTCAYSAQ